MLRKKTSANDPADWFALREHRHHSGELIDLIKSLLPDYFPNPKT
jgi:hypothetical protein